MTNIMAQGPEPDHSFSYQGELLENGTPANGNYDITIQGYSSELGASTLGTISTHLNISVSNGLFNLNNVDLDSGFSSPFDGDELWLQVAVRATGSITYTDLSPRQQLQAVPYAAKLTNGNASFGQVYTFNGSQWNAADPMNNSPWLVSGNEISYTLGNVGIGVSTLGTNLPIARLEIATPDTVPVQFQGGDGMYNTYYENGVYRGYVGSFQGANVADFEIGTGGSNTMGNMHITTQAIPRITVAADGATSIMGDTKQPITTNGVMKYMVEAFCSTSPSIVKSYIGVTNSTGSITATGGLVQGECEVNFPGDLSNRYWQVSTVSPHNRHANCILVGTNKLICRTFSASTGTGVNGIIMLLVY